MEENTVRLNNTIPAGFEADLELLNSRLCREIREHQLRHLNVGEDAVKGMEGLFLSDSQIESTLECYQSDDSSPAAGPPSLQIKDGFSKASPDSPTASDLNGREGVRLERFRQVLKLSDFDVRVIVLCLAPELDKTYELLFAFLQDDVGKRRPTVQLALQVLADSLEDRIRCRQSFSPGAPLLKYALVQMNMDPYCQSSGSLSKSLNLDPRVLDYLLGFNPLDDQLGQFASIWEGEQPWTDVVLATETRSRLQELPVHIQRLTEADQPVLVQFFGPAGCGKQTVSRAVCHALNRRMLTIDLEALLTCGQDISNLLHRAHREALLQEAVILFRNGHHLSGLGPQERMLTQAMEGLLSERREVTIISGHTPWIPFRTVPDLASLILDIPAPGYPERKLLWEQYLPHDGSSISDEELNLLVGNYGCSGGQIKESIDFASSMARWRGPDNAEVTFDDLVESFRYASSRGQGKTASDSRARHSWDDLILPDDRKRQLLEVCACFRNTSLVYDQWGFDPDSSRGKGLNLLFVGSSGTGKTMAAELIACSLELDLHRIDLSNIVSKYVGETEKNLEAIFRQAQEANRILLFDEADALFGKRAEIRDSHDRYANLEVSYLLQKMEEYQGIAILTTNLRNNLDDAFLRRLHFVVEFPFPDEEQRLLIWRRVFPAAAPLQSDIDLAFMARQFRLAGGNIKNIAVAAAFLAAYDGSNIEMKHLTQATRREYQKMGKLLTEQEFGPYFEMATA